MGIRWAFDTNQAISVAKSVEQKRNQFHFVLDSHDEHSVCVLVDVQDEECEWIEDENVTIQLNV